MTTEKPQQLLPRMVDRSNKKVFFKKKQECVLCLSKTDDLDYKNPELLKKYISEGKRILPKRITNLCAKHQRQLTSAIKHARFLSLLPYVYQSD